LLETVVSEVPFERFFTIKGPIYKGAPELEITVEIVVDASSGALQFYFMSDNLYEAIINQRNELIEETLKELESFGCSIIDVI